MGYRGEDLDLRTPQTWAAAGDLGAGPHGDPGFGGPRGRSGFAAAPPIWVDELVLAACNHAFDVAAAHRAGEVRIEHLLHALTRIDAAAEVLETHGLRVAALRRHTATIIASEMPAVAGAGAPRRSDALEEVLRIAAAHAYRRNAPAAVEDLLHALIDVRPDLPGAHLVGRSGPRMPADSSEPPQRLSPYLEPPFAANPSFPPPGAFVPAPRGLPPSAPYEPRPRTAAPAPPQSDPAQTARLEALEQMLRTLGADLAGERQALTGLLQNLQRDVAAVRADDAPQRQLEARLAAIDEAMQSRLAALADRLTQVEQAVTAPQPQPQIDVSPLQERMSQIEFALSSRLETFEAQLAAARPPAVDLGPLSSRLDVIEEALLRGDDGAGREIAARVGELDQGLLALRGESKSASEAANGELKALAGALAAQAQAADAVQAVVQERIQALTSAVDRLGRDLQPAVIAAFEERLGRLGVLVEQRGADQAQAMASLSERLAAAETRLAEQLRQVREAQQGLPQQLAELQEALVKLNTNQHTLAGAVDQWRLHVHSELGVVAGRLQGIEREVARPVPMLETLSAGVDGLNRAFVERYHRRNRLWYWLFGTDDWIAASWPSQLAKMEEERKGAVSRQD